MSMDSTGVTPTPTVPPRGRRLGRLLAWGVGGLGLAALALVAALPWVLGTGPARGWLLARATAALAPGAFEVDGFRWSWTGPTELSGFVLRDRDGDRVVSAPRAVWDRNLWQILTDRAHLGTLTLEGGALDVERQADGSFDLTEVLKPVLSPEPENSLRIKVVDGTLRLRAPNLAEPIEGRDFALDFIRPSAPEPITAEFSLTGPAAPDGSGPATASGKVRYGRWEPAPEGPHPLSAEVTSHAWPLALDLGDLTWRGRVGGTIRPALADGRWSASGDTTLDGFDLAGPALNGDRLELASVTAGFDVAQTEAGLRATRLTLDAGVLDVEGSGAWPPTAVAAGATRLNGRIDLAELARRLPHTLRLREGLTIEQGAATFAVTSSAEGGQSAWDATAEVVDLAATHEGKPIALEQPAKLGARLVGGADTLSLERFDVSTAFLRATGSGDVDRGISVDGTLDLAALRRQAAALVDVGTFQAVGTGTFQAGYRRQAGTYAATFGMDLAGLDLNRTIRAEKARIEGNVQGPADARGLPTGWSGGHFQAKGGDLDATAEVASRDGRPVAIDATVTTPVRRGEALGRADARLKARLDGAAWAVDEAVVGLTPPRAWVVTDRVELAMTGRYDPQAGSLTLANLRPPAGPAPLALGPQGIQLTGLGGDTLKLQAGLTGDVAAGARVLWAWTGEPPPLPDPTGTWTLGLDGSPAGADLTAFRAVFSLPDLAWSAADADGDGQPDGRQQPGPLGMTATGGYRRGVGRLELDDLALTSPYGGLTAAGTITDPMGARLADLRGTLSPDYARLNQLLVERVEPQARIAGQARPFTVRGALGVDDPIRTLEAEVGLDLLGVDVLGMRLGATPLVGRISGGAITIDPIRTSLNNGVIALVPELRRAESGGWILALGAGSGIQDAEINDEVSDRVLSYAAPVMDRATKVNGRISAQLDRAEFPLEAGRRHEAVVEGRVLFQDVEFTPGPLAQTLTSLTGRPPSRIRLTDPIRLWIGDGVIHEEGLVIPVGNLTRIAINGDIGFNRQLALVASVPLLPTMLQGRPILEGFLGGQQIDVPIGGTVKDPQVDKAVFQAGLDQLGENLLMKSATTGAASILEKLAQPRDPLIPRMTPQERRLQRQQRRLDRRLGGP